MRNARALIEIDVDCCALPQTHFAGRYSSLSTIVMSTTKDDTDRAIGLLSEPLQARTFTRARTLLTNLFSSEVLKVRVLRALHPGAARPVHRPARSARTPSRRAAADVPRVVRFAIAAAPRRS